MKSEHEERVGAARLSFCILSRTGTERATLRVPSDIAALDGKAFRTSKAHFRTPSKRGVVHSLSIRVVQSCFVFCFLFFVIILFLITFDVFSVGSRHHQRRRPVLTQCYNVSWRRAVDSDEFSLYLI